MDTLTLALRVGFSLTIVLGLMWFAARVLKAKAGARGAGVLEVLARQQVGRGASVAVVRVADRALIVGVTEQGVSMLGEPLADLGPFAERPAHSRRSAEGALVTSRDGGLGTAGLTSPTPSGRLGGSILSRDTWRQAMHALREWTVRR